MLKTTISFLRSHLGRVIDQVAQRGDRIVIDRHGRPIAAIVPYRDYKALMECDESSPDYLAWHQSRKMEQFTRLNEAVLRNHREDKPDKPKVNGDDTMVRDPWKEAQDPNRWKDPSRP